MIKKIILFFSIIIISCTDDPNNSFVAPQPMSSLALTYLNSALDIMQNNSINKYQIEWISFRSNTFEHAGSAQTTSDTYNAIRFAISNLGDNHSFFREPEPNIKISPTILSFQITEDILYKSTLSLVGQRIKKNIGFIRIPSFSGSSQLSINFANEIQNLMEDIDSDSVKGWIVDLRHNLGGNMWPMLAGIGPILGNGLAGKFIDPDNNVSNWYYEDGKALLDNSTLISVANYCTLINPNPYVAVLTDSLTASSGEAIVIAFKGRANTRSFGDYTFGVSTANRGYPLSDGAMIILTVSTMADRNGNLYGNEIKPDEIIIGEFKEDPTDNDIVVSAAIIWLENNI